MAKHDDNWVGRRRMNVHLGKPTHTILGVDVDHFCQTVGNVAKYVELIVGRGAVDEVHLLLQTQYVRTSFVLDYSRTSERLH